MTVKLNEMEILVPFALDFAAKRIASKQIAKLYELDWLEENGNWASHLCTQYGIVEDYDDYARTLHRLINHEKYQLECTKAIRISDCGKSWFFSVWHDQRVKGLDKINHCGDKFCLTCQKLKQAQRLLRFYPAIRKIAEDYDLYHMVLTQPNCCADNLQDTMQTMFDKFYHLNRYLNENAKIKGVDFKQYGYGGSLRSFECTYKLANRKSGKEYHPHLHVIVALRKGLEMMGEHLNDYSTSSKKSHVRYFTDFEILIQKIWRLLITGEKVTLKNIDSLNIGYSCTVDKINFADEKETKSNLYEVFKYATKVYAEDKGFMDLEQFNTLRNALHGRRIIQGYGVLHGLNESEELNETIEVLYEMFTEFLNKTELPRYTSAEFEEVFRDLCQDQPEFRYISKKMLYQLTPEEIERIKAGITREDFDAALEHFHANNQIMKRLGELERGVEKLKSTVNKSYEDYTKLDELKDEQEQIRLNHFQIYRRYQAQRGNEVILPDGTTAAPESNDLPF